MKILPLTMIVVEINVGHFFLFTSIAKIKSTQGNALDLIQLVVFMHLRGHATIFVTREKSFAEQWIAVGSSSA